VTTKSLAAYKREKTTRLCKKTALRHCCVDQMVIFGTKMDKAFYWDRRTAATAWNFPQPLRVVTLNGRIDVDIHPGWVLLTFTIFCIEMHKDFRYWRLISFWIELDKDCSGRIAAIRIYLTDNNFVRSMTQLAGALLILNTNVRFYAILDGQWCPLIEVYEIFINFHYKYKKKIRENYIKSKLYWKYIIALSVS